MKFDMETLKEYYPQLLIIIGIIPIILHSLAAFKQYAIINTINKFAAIIDQLFFQSKFDSLLTNLVASNFGTLITALIGFAVAAILIIYLMRIIKNPMKNDYMIIAVLGIAAIFLNAVVGGILIIIGGVVGFNRNSE